jgi:broad specificity phosphatase PhoE
VPTLILVKHSLPEIDPTRPANQWHLSEAGRLRCAALAERLAEYQIAVVVSSREPKAIETAHIVAARLNLPFETAPDLHEHDRSNMPHLNAEQFRKAAARLFDEPDRVVFGAESAVEAQRRFARAVSRVEAQRAGHNVAIISHGTVISLFVARHNTLDARELWHKLGLPSFIALSLPDMQLMEIVETI